MNEVWMFEDHCGGRLILEAGQLILRHKFVIISLKCKAVVKTWTHKKWSAKQERQKGICLKSHMEYLEDGSQDTS